jgi:hypothetical protein
MAIPYEDVLKEELLLFLVNEPDYSATSTRAYEQLARLHPELTEGELHDPYPHSVSHWANRVQFARQRLVEAGFLYKPNAHPSAPRGQWMLTPRGISEARRLLGKA